MTVTVTSRNSANLPPRTEDRRLRAPTPVRRFAVRVATGLVLAASLLAVCTACSGAASTLHGGQEVDWMNITDHLYLNKDGTKYEISVGQDASGNDVVTVTPVGG
jgi:hypothetical protein